MKKILLVICLIIVYFGMIVLVVKLSPSIEETTTIEDNQEETIPEEEVIDEEETKIVDDDYKIIKSLIDDAERIKTFDFRDKTAIKEKGPFILDISLSDKGIKYSNFELTVTIPFDSNNIKSIRIGDGGDGFCFSEMYILTKDNKVYMLKTAEEESDDFVYQKDMNKLERKLLVEDATAIDLNNDILVYKSTDGKVYAVAEGEIESCDFEPDPIEGDDYEEEELSSKCQKYDNTRNNATGIHNKYVGVSKNEDDLKHAEAYLMDKNCSKKILTEIDDRFDEWIPQYGKINDNYFSLTAVCQATCKDYTLKIYNTDLKLIASGELDYALSYEVLDNGNIKIWKKGTNVVTIYNPAGEVVKTIDKYKNVLGITRDFILYNDNSTLKLVSESGKIVEISKIKSNDDFRNIVDWAGHYIYIDVVDRNVTLDMVWNDCKKDYYCDFKSKKEYVEEYGITDDTDFGYNYTYNTKCDRLTKEVKYFDNN